MKKTYKLFVNLGLIIIIYGFLLGLASVVVAYTLKDTPVSVPCSVEIEESNIDVWLNKYESNKVTYHYSCTTVYIDLEVDDTLEKEEMAAIGINLSLSKPKLINGEVLIHNNNFDCFITLLEDGKISLSIKSKE